MRRVALTVVIAALVVAPGAAAGTALDGELVREINRVRAAHARGPLKADTVLQRAAASHSGDMLRRDYFSHGDFAARMRRFGARGPMLGENLAWASGPFATAHSLVRLWLESPPHRANVLRRTFGRIGIAAMRGRFQGVDGAVVVTADFAGPGTPPARTHSPPGDRPPEHVVHRTTRLIPV